MATVSLTAPTDWQSQQADIQRRMAMAQAMQQQGQEPLGPTQSINGVAIPQSWTQGLAKALQTGVGAYQQRQALNEQRDLSKRYGEAQTGDAQALAAYLRGTPGTPEAMDENMVTTPATPGTAPMSGTMPSFQTPEYRQMLAQMMMKQAEKGAEPYTLAPGAQRFGPGNVPIASAPFKPELGQSIGAGGLLKPDGSIVAPQPAPHTATPLPPGHTRTVREGEEQVTQELQADGSWKEIGRGPAFAKSVAGVTTIHNPAPVTPVTIADPNDPTGMGTVVIDGRTQQVLGKGPKLTQTGAVDQKLATQMPQAKLRVGSMNQTFDRLDSALQDLHDDPGLSHITGSIAGRTPNLLNTATGAQAKLNSVKSQIFQESLQAMREASKTGGAVGNVSDREGDKLERTLAALDQAQGTKDFQKQLRKAQDQVRLSKQLIQNAYDEQFGGVQSTPTGAPRQSGGASGSWSVVR